MSDGNMTYEDWLRGCVHHDGRHGYVTLPCDEVLKIADFIERLRADRKIENCSEKENNCEPQLYEIGYHDGFHQAMADEEARVLKSAGIYPKTEPTISKMEQVGKDINVRSKTVLTGETNARIVDKWEREMTERSQE